MFLKHIIPLLQCALQLFPMVCNDHKIGCVTYIIFLGALCCAYQWNYTLSNGSIAVRDTSRICRQCYVILWFQLEIKKLVDNLQLKYANLRPLKCITRRYRNLHGDFCGLIAHHVFVLYRKK